MATPKKMLPGLLGDSARSKTRETLPKRVLGTVQVQWVRCGKPTCRCATGALHGPYTYLFWRERGRLRKQYVPPKEADAIRRACDERRAHRRQTRALLHESRHTWRQLLVLLREVERGG